MNSVSHVLDLASPVPQFYAGPALYYGFDSAEERAMGVFGAGLYSGDFAMDLRAMIGAVVRLPFDATRLLEILCDADPAAAKNMQVEDYTTFWLVVADQFDKRGIDCEVVRDTALGIIDSGADIAVLTKLGMKTGDLNKRVRILSELRARVASPPEPKPRPILKKPQPLLMEIGDVLIHPSAQGKCINPYFPSKERMPGGWQPDGWNAAVIVDNGRAFDFLAWYRPLTPELSLNPKPDLPALRSLQPWILRGPGTCSGSHFEKMELEKIGKVEVDRIHLQRVFPGMPGGTSAAVNDISIANQLNVALNSRAKKTLSISSLTEILTGA